jgi:hypothetical protein
LAPNETRCGGCGALVPDISGPVHAYMSSAPGCWARYTSVLAARDSFADRTRAQWAVDSYAAQHVGNDDPRNRQSVAVHLMSLCASLEHGVPGLRLRRLLGQWAVRPGTFPLLEPRPQCFEVTVAEVARSALVGRHEVMRAWANATWQAWSGHHDDVRRWLNGTWQCP